MKRTKFTRLAGSLVWLPFMCLPLMGQERGTVNMEPAVRESVQLRADETEALPDSVILYDSNGERQTKYVCTGENQGTYQWENNAWRFESAEVDPYYTRLSSKYNPEEYNVQSTKVSYEIIDEELRFCFPYIQFRYAYYSYPANTDVKPEFDTHGNLTSLKLSKGDWNVNDEFTITYNARNNPVSIEGRWDGDLDFKAHYEYNDYGYATLFDRYYWNGEIWVNSARETAEYDAQGKMLFHYYYESGKIKVMGSYEYYDENHFSSESSEYYGNNSSSARYEYKHGTDGKLGAYYTYFNGELYNYIIFYPNTLDNHGNANEPVADMRIWSYGGTLHVRTAQSTTLHVYTLTGALHARQALPAGETTLPLPPGIYIVKVGNATEKIAIGK